MVLHIADREDVVGSAEQVGTWRDWLAVGNHRAIDIDGSMKSRAWDFLTKLSRDADLTGLDLKIPQNAADRRVRTARVDLNHRAVLFAVGEQHEPMWLLAAIKPA